MGGETWSLLQSVVSGLVGAGVVYFFGIRQLVVQRRLAFVERQMVEFYAPLAGIRKQILAKCEVRYKVSQAAHSAWQDICRSYGNSPMLDHEKRFAPFHKIFEYDNEQLRAELLPKYRDMLALFTERYYLAAPDTRIFYEPFLEFVEIWNRWLGESLPVEVLEKLEHGEEGVKPFYEHLESKMESLQMEVSRGGGWHWRLVRQWYLHWMQAASGTKKNARPDETGRGTQQWTKYFRKKPRRGACK